MLRQVRVRAVLVATVILALSFSSVRAKQLYDEQSARSALQTARTDFLRTLDRATQQGLTRQDLQPVLHTAQNLSAHHAPATSPIWNSTSAAYFKSQTRAYVRLRSALKLTLNRVTAKTRSEALRSVSDTRARVQQAENLGISTREAASEVGKQAVLLGTALSPESYRAIAATLKRVQATLSQSISAQHARLATMVRQTGNNVQGVAALSATRAAASQEQLNLIELLKPGAASYSARLQEATQAVSAQSSPTMAAVKELHVESLARTISLLFYATIPQRMIVVSTESQSASMYQDGRQIYSTLVTTGGPELPTDHGVFHIYEKISPFVFHSPWPPDSPYYYSPTPVQFWMPFDGGEGLHDASWRSNYGPGSNLATTDLGGGRSILGTHGCVNLPYEAAQFVWNWAPLGTTVVVV